MRFLAGLWIMVFAMGAVAASATEETLFPLGASNDFYGKPPTTVWRTEATNWGEGIAPLRVTAVMTTWTTREASELMERLPAAVTPIQCRHNTQFAVDADYLGLPREEVVRRAVRASAASADVILAGRIIWGTLPNEVRYNLLKQVKEGAGLVVVNPREPIAELGKIFSGREIKDDAPFLTRGILGPDLNPLKDGAGNPEIRMYSFGKGRVLVVRYPNEKTSEPNEGVTQYQPFTVCNGYDSLYPDESVVRYDYQVAALAREVLWAARFTPAAAINRMEIIGREATVSLSGLFAGKKILVRIRDTAGRVYLEKQYPAAASVRIALPGNLPAGRLFLDARVPGCDWYTRVFSAGIPEVACTLACVPENGAPGRTVQVGAAVNPVPEKGIITLRVYDMHGDVIVRPLSISCAGENEFSVVVPGDVRSDLLRMEAVVTADGRVAGRGRGYLPVRRATAYDEYRLQGWDDGGALPPTHLSRQMRQRFAEAGVDFSYVASAYGAGPETNRISTRRNAEYGMKSVPYSTWLGTYGTTDQRDNNLYDPVYRASLRDSLRKVAAAYAPYGAPWYSLGDESRLSAGVELDFSEATRREFITYVRAKYHDDLSAVNTAWATGYKDWNEIAGMKKDEAVRKGEFGRWIDFRMFMYKSYNDFLTYAADCIRSVDAGALTGSEGVEGSDPNTGFRWDTIFSWYHGFFPYISPNGEETYRIARSFMKKDSFRGGIVGAYDYLAPGGYTEFSGRDDLSRDDISSLIARYQVWLYMSQGMNAAFWWTLTPGIGVPGPSAFAPDFTVLPMFDAMLQEIGFLKSGVAKLLLNCTWTDDRVAMLYSPLSTIITEAAETTSWGGSARVWCNFLEHAGIEYTFISEADLAAGALDRKRFDHLVAPGCAGLEDASVKAITEFCRQGGKVVADVYPGKRAATGRLRNPLPFETGPAVGRLSLYNGFGGEQAGNNGLIRLSRFAEFISRVGMKSWYTVKTPEGGPPRLVAGSTFSGANNTRFLLLLAGMMGPTRQEVVVHLPAEPAGMNVYNLRTNALLPVKDGDVRLTLTAGNGEILGIVPCRVQGVSWTPKRRTLTAGETLTGTVSLDTGGKAAGTHVVRVKYRSPDGREIPQFFTKLLLKDGRAETMLDLPYNAPGGAWKCEVQDVMSGARTSGEFTVTAVRGEGEETR